MKKISVFLSLFLIIASCSKTDTTSENTKKATETLDKKTVFSFDVNSLTTGCTNSSEIVCAINQTIKCTLNPEFDGCAQAKDKIPSFVFMQDESLQRPTFQSYKVIKLTPREDGAVEVYTQSSCNGNWFGLCSGNIIYVMKHIDSAWIVSDMYATEF